MHRLSNPIAGLVAMALIVGAAGHHTTAAADAHVKAMTFNIRLSPANDGDNQWANRNHMVVEVIRRFDCDFVGVQEAWPDQIAFLRENLPGYRHIGRSREVDADKGEGTPLFYRHDRWKLDPGQHGTFWLSDTPQEQGSKTWGNVCPRTVTWARFIDKNSERAVYVYNTHFSHMSEGARQKSAEQLARVIAERKDNDPVILTGDFNAGESSGPVLWLKGEKTGAPVQLADSFRVLHPDATEAGTFNGFKGTKTGAKIDYVFILPAKDAPPPKVTSAKIIHTNHDGRYPSDHFPVTTEVAFPSSQ